MEQRLQRVLAAAGVASRRKAEEWITGGRVKVNGETVTVQGTNVDLDRDEITVDGQKISVASKRHYIALHKPIGYVSTVSDPHADKKVVDLVHIDGARLVPVGRLDADSEGLLLMSDDGDFVFKVTHPSQSMGKTYIATVKGRPDVSAMDRLSRGLKLSDGYVTAPAGAKLLAKGREPGTSVLELILHEGKYRQVRRMLDTIGHPVLRLVRTRVGPVMLGDLQPGEWRPLTQNELRLIEEGKNAPDMEPEEEERRGQRGHYDGDRREPQRERSFAPADRRPQGPPRDNNYGQGSGGRPAPRPAGRPAPGGDRPQYGGTRPSGGAGDRPSFQSDRSQGGNRPSGGNGRPSFGGDRSSFGGGDRRPQGPPRDGGDRRFSGPPRDVGDRRLSGPPPRRPMGQGDGNDRPRFGGDRPQGQNDRPRFGGDRPQYGGGGNRPSFGGGGNRPSFGGGGNRPSFGGDRPQGNGDRPRFGGDRPSFGGGDRRPQGPPRDSGGGDRPRFGGNDRPQNNGGRPSFGGNRPPSGGGDRPSYGGDRPRFGGSGDRPQFGGGRPPQGRGDNGSRPNNSFRGGGDAPRRPFNGGNNGSRPSYRPEQKPRDGKTR